MLMPDFYEYLLTPNKWSRCGRKLSGVKYIVYHYVQNPNSKALATRNYFEMRKFGKLSYGSAQYIIDPYDIIRCIPENEVAYAVGKTEDYPYTKWKEDHFGDECPNDYTINIELHHINKEGQFEESTIISAANLGAFLCDKYKLDPFENIIRHADVCKKECPLWWVMHPDDFDAFKHLAAGLI